MIENNRLFFVAAWLLLLAGCASVPTQPPAKTTPQEAIPQVTIPQQAMPQAAPQVAPQAAIEPVPKQAMSGNPAVVALLDRAQLDTAAGRSEAAGASLERGLRIEPRNAWLWQELAQLRLSQGQYAQAISLAQKSMSFAAQERRLLALDWRVIANARVAQGNQAEAEQAFQRATELEQAVQMEADHGF